MALGFQKKRVGHLILRNLRNRTKPHLSSIGPIEVNEVSDPKIKDFLAEEDSDCQRSDPAQLYDFVNNLPLCLKDKGEFNSIRFGPGNITSSIDVASLDYTLHQHIVSPGHYEVFLRWIERNYIDIPILQAQIKSLENHNELLIKEHREIRENEQRQDKRLRKTCNIVIKNADSVNAIINYELS